MQIKRYLTVFAGFTLLSRFLGLIRDIFIAYRLGASVFSDIFFAAFRLPNLFRSIFAEGAFNNVFLPIYCKILSKQGKDLALKFAYRVQSLLFLALLTIVIFFELFMGGMVAIFAPGLTIAKQGSLFFTVARVIFPYVLLISASSLYVGILNSAKKFGPGAFCPVILNLCLIFALFFDLQNPQSTLYLMSFAVIAAGSIQVLYLALVLYKKDLLPKKTSFIFDNNLKNFLKKFLPAAFSAEVYQINIFLDTFFASTVINGLSYLYYADRIIQLPLALIGVALNTIILPFLSKAASQDQKDSIVQIHNKAMQIAVLFGLPSAVGIYLLSDRIIDCLFVFGGQFTKQAALQTASALQVYSLALPACILNKIFITVFFARGQTKKPIFFALTGVITNLVLNFFLVDKYQHVGIAFASVVSAWLSFALLIYHLKKESLFSLNKKTQSLLTTVFFATSAMVFALEIIESFIESYSVFFGIILIKTISLFFTCAAGIAVYFTVFFLLKNKVAKIS